MRVAAFAASVALLSAVVVESRPVRADQIFAFQCLKAGDQAVIALGSMDRPAFNVAMNPQDLKPLQGSGLFPFALVQSKLGGVFPQKRCSTIATRLTNLALATQSASPLGIINLTNYFVAGRLHGTPVIAINQLSYGDVLGTLPASADPKATLSTIDQRVRLISAGKALTNALNSGDVVVFEEVEVIEVQ